MRRWLLPALLAALTAAPALAQDLGRLFTSTTQRVQLDEIRRQAQLPKLEPEVEPTPKPVERAATAEPEPVRPVVDRLTINGVVRRSGGRGTVWVNGDEVARGGMTREGIRIQDTGRRQRNVRIRLPSGVDTIELKPGQEIDVVSGTVLESYERRPVPGATRSAFEEPESPPLPLSAPDAAAGAAPQAAAGTGDGGQLPDAARNLPAPDEPGALERLRELAGRGDAGGARSPQ